jgi:hypothetical protein
MSNAKYLLPAICIAYVLAVAAANAKPEHIYSIHELEMMKPPQDKKGVLIHAMGEGLLPESSALLDENCSPQCLDIVGIDIATDIEAQPEVEKFLYNLARAQTRSKKHRFYVVLRVDTHYVRHVNGWTPLAFVTVTKIISQSFDSDTHWRKLHSKRQN